MPRTGRPKKYDDPKAAILAGKRRYREKKKRERKAAESIEATVNSCRCTQCGIEVKPNLIAKGKTICVWCEYDTMSLGKTRVHNAPS